MLKLRSLSLVVMWYCAALRLAYAQSLPADHPTKSTLTEASTVDTSSGDRWQLDYLRGETERIEAKHRQLMHGPINLPEEPGLRDDLRAIHQTTRWNADRARRRTQLLEMLGLYPQPEKSDLLAVVTGRIDREDFSVEKLHFQSRPGLYVTANLYLPKNVDKPAPAILYLCGHGASKKDGISYGNKVTYQHHGIWFAQHGYVCLVLDTLEMGEIEGEHHGTSRRDRWWWNAVGYTPAGVEAWNCIRALDYLETRKEVDATRIGATGRSGGGAYTWWIAALDERIKAAVPVAGITDLRNHVIDGKVDGHCDCMYYLNTHQWDFGMIPALVAPRPLLIANTDNDPIFPLDGVLRIYQQTRDLYAYLKASDKLGLQISAGGHKDTPELQVAALRFFDKHLRGEDRVIRGAAAKQFEPKELKVFDTLPADERNTTVDEWFTGERKMADVARLSGKQMLPHRDVRTPLTKALNRGWPADRPDIRNVPRLAFSAEQDGLRLSAYEITIHAGLTLPLYQVELEANRNPKSSDVEIVDNDEGWSQFRSALAGRFEQAWPENKPVENDAKHFTALKARLAASKGDLFIFAPRGVGATIISSDAKARTQLRRRYMLLGQTFEGMQLWDIRRALQTVRSIHTEHPHELRGRSTGSTASLLLHAALFESINDLELVDLPTTYLAGPNLMDAMRHSTMPETVLLVAQQMPVTLINAKPADWQLVTAGIKKLELNAENFKVKRPDTSSPR